MARTTTHRTGTTPGTTTRTWTVTVGAAVVVAALLLVVWWLGQPPAPSSGLAAPGSSDPVGGSTGNGSTGSSGAGGPVAVEPGEEDPGAGIAADPVQPPIGRDPVLAEGAVRIDSFVVRGDRLLLNYTTGVPECYGEVALEDVQEHGDRVTVSLRSVLPADRAEVCIDLAVTATLAVDLREHLGERSVVDGSYDPIVLVARVQRPYAAPAPGTTAG